VKHRSILEYANFRWFKIALVLCALSGGVYIWHDPPLKPYGGTWLGYTLGTIGALLILWLLYFGVRKRRYKSNVGTAQGWLSAHVYLGVALIVVATLHTGFELGWNVHTLAYVLMILVIASGMYGVFIYLRVPREMTVNAGEDTQGSQLRPRALRARPRVPHVGGGEGAADARQGPHRRAAHAEQGGLPAPAAEERAAAAGPPRHALQGGARPLALYPRAVVDRAAGRADHPRRFRVHLLVGAP
jgi:hypothetical protein